MKCKATDCDGKTGVVDSRTAANPGNWLPPQLPALYPHNWWRWRRHRCKSCSEVTDTLEMSLDDMEYPPEAPQSPVAAQIERELGELVASLRKCAPTMWVASSTPDFEASHAAWAEVLAMLALFDESDDV
jgi:hypothetical protein